MRTHLVLPRRAAAFAVAALLPLFACGKQQKPPAQTSAHVSSQNSAAQTGARGGSFTEDFEQASKGGYAAGEEKFASGAWKLNEALVGSEQNDRKNGSKALRIRNSGSAQMAFDVSGARSVTLRYASYGKDKPSTWELRMSADGGASWKTLGKPQTSSEHLQKATFDVRADKAVRFGAFKTDGAQTRLNIDDFAVSAAGEASATNQQTHNTPAAPASGGHSGGGSGGGETHPPTQTSKSVHLAMGVPADADPSDDYLLVKSQYALSYNNVKHVPNWVGSNLNASYFGPVPRFQGKFMPDITVPETMYRVKHDDYTGSGYDRGHMVRSEERTATPDDNTATFLTSNLLPQTHDLNAGPWLRFEEECQRLAQRENKELYIVCGGIYAKNYPTIGKGKVAVPEKCFKIVVVLNRGQGLKDVTANTRVLAIIMPNVTGIIHESWDKYATSVDEIEKATGYDFLNALPADAQAAIESRVGK